MTELDQWAAKEAMGWKSESVDGIPMWWVNGRLDVINWHPTKNLNQAFMVVQVMIDQGYELRERVGLGATAVDGKTLRHLTSVAPRIRFNGESYPNLFPFRDSGGVFIGEDYVFSMALGEAGNMYVDTRLRFGHAARW